MKRNKLALFVQPLGQPVLAIFCALLVGAMAILVTGENPLTVYAAMLKGAFGSTYYLLTTLTRATPIIICGWARRSPGVPTIWA
jgi:simple sugar transport system permease protein